MATAAELRIELPQAESRHTPARRTWRELIAPDGDLATPEPKTLRFRMLHVPARLTRGSRQRRLRIPAHWPWAGQIAAAFATILAIPAPT